MARTLHEAPPTEEREPLRSRPKTRGTRPVQLIRRALLVFLVLAVLTIGALLLFGRAGLPGDGKDEATAIASDRGLTEDVLIAGEGFDFTVTAGEKTLFAVRAQRTLSDRDQNVFLEDVEIEVAREGGTYVVRGRQARVNRETQEAQVEGDVVVLAPDDVRLETDWLQLRNGGNLLVASRGSRIAYGDQIVGRSENMRLHLEEELAVFDGGVELDSTEQAEVPLAVRAERIRFSKPRRILRAEGDVDVQWGGDQLQAQRLTVRLDELLDEVTVVRAIRQVRGVVSPPAGEDGQESAGRIAFSSWGLLAVFEPGTQQPQSLELEALRNQRAVLISRTEAGIERELEGRLLTASFRDGKLQEADALGPMTLIERQLLPGTEAEQLRRAEARGAQALFDSLGNLVRLELRGEVLLADQRVEATGDAANVELTGPPSVLVGEPVNIVAEQGRMQAPRVEYQEKSGLLHAMEGVRTLLEDSGQATSAALAGDGPLRVDSEEAFLRSEPEEEFIFKGGVRAWRGRNLMLADQLRGNQTTRELAASGEVKTLWYPSDEDEAEGEESAEQALDFDSPSPDEEASGEPTPEDLGRSPIEITAGLMNYAEASGRLTYDDDVVVLQASRTLSCDHLVVEMTEGSERDAELLRCEVGARLVDPIQGVTIDGDWALYRVSDREVEFHGTPVTVVDAQRRLEGPEFLYRLDDGFFKMGLGSTVKAERPEGET